ncbi:MAG: ATP-binding protein [Nanoarchaeota archaeon]
MANDIILMQKRELEKKLQERFIERKQALKESGDMISVITGPRRAGKSFFAMHALKNFGYANFDDEKLAETKDYDDILNAISQAYGSPKCLFFDEIQNLPKWELFANRLQRQGYKLVLTGSNSNLLSMELASHLTGRHIPITLLPFSFAEFLDFKGKELTESEKRAGLEQYMIYGGYPEPLVKNIDYKEYLSALLSSTIYKDIVKRHKIRKPQAIEGLALYLLSNIAREFSYNTLATLTKCKSVHSAERYLGFLEETFLFFTISRLSFSAKKSINSGKKIYCIDNGLVYAKSMSLSPDKGRLYENLVAIALKKKELNSELKVYYWKNEKQEEVDFAVKEGHNVVQLIQVCASCTDMPERETRALIKASGELKCDNLLVITEQDESEKTISWFGMEKKIKFMPLWKWLLEQK